MGESLTERRRVDDEGRKVVKSFYDRGITGAGNGTGVTVGHE